MGARGPALDDRWIQERLESSAQLGAERKPKRSHLQEALLLGALMFISFFVVTINFRAVAQANYFYTFSTDLAICALNWSILKRVQDAEHWYERAGYIIGGPLGAQAAIWCSLHLLGK